MKKDKTIKINHTVIIVNKINYIDMPKIKDSVVMFLNFGKSYKKFSFKNYDELTLELSRIIEAIDFPVFRINGTIMNLRNIDYVDFPELNSGSFFVSFAGYFKEIKIGIFKDALNVAKNLCGHISKLNTEESRESQSDFGIKF